MAPRRQAPTRSGPGAGRGALRLRLGRRTGELDGPAAGSACGGLLDWLGNDRLGGGNLRRLGLRRGDAGRGRLGRGSRRTAAVVVGVEPVVSVRGRGAGTGVGPDDVVVLAVRVGAASGFGAVASAVGAAAGVGRLLACVTDISLAPAGGAAGSPVWPSMTLPSGRTDTVFTRRGSPRPGMTPGVDWASGLGACAAMPDVEATWRRTARLRSTAAPRAARRAWRQRRRPWAALRP